ncbi:uncharacterized protein [Aquarana catesbeiana]|uniref:uncharacterized protein isoform X1 n=1 Tax=Aquarana catesbeiana TaxID=8400 RepID=UPI003CC9600C
MKTGKGHNACLQWWWTESLINVFLLIPCVLGEGQQSDSFGNIRHHWLLIAVFVLAVIGSILITTLCLRIGSRRIKEENKSLAKNMVPGHKKKYESVSGSNVAKDRKQRTEHSDCHTLLDNHPQSEEGNVKPHPYQKHKSRSQSDPETINREARRVPNADGESYRHSHKPNYHQKRSDLKFPQEGWAQDLPRQWNISQERNPRTQERAYKPPTEVDFPEHSYKRPREHALASSDPRSKQQKNEKWNKDGIPTQSYSSTSHVPTVVPHNAYAAHGSVLLSKEVDFPEHSSKRPREHALASSDPRSKQQNEKWNKDVIPTQSYSSRSHVPTVVPHNAYAAHGSVLLSKEVDFPEHSSKRPREHALASSDPRSKQQKNEKWNKDGIPTQSYGSTSHVPTVVPDNAYAAHGSVLLSKGIGWLTTTLTCDTMHIDMHVTHHKAC